MSVKTSRPITWQLNNLTCGKVNGPPLQYDLPTGYAQGIEHPKVIGSRLMLYFSAEGDKKMV